MLLTLTHATHGRVSSWTSDTLLELNTPLPQLTPSELLAIRIFAAKVTTWTRREHASSQSHHSRSREASISLWHLPSSQIAMATESIR